MLSLAMAAAILSAADIQAAVGADPAMCQVVRYARDGARTEQPPTKPFRPPPERSVSVRSDGGPASSSISASSGSSGASTASSQVSRDGVTIIFDQDDNGCRIVIDERTA